MQSNTGSLEMYTRVQKVERNKHYVTHNKGSTEGSDLDQWRMRSKSDLFQDEEERMQSLLEEEP